MNISQHFTLAELTVSETAARHGLLNEPDALALAQLHRLCDLILEPLRAGVKRPVLVQSGYRSLKVNALVGGSRTSHHMEGRAADIIVPGMSPIEVCHQIRLLRLPFDQCINEFGRWCHVSVALDPAAARRELLTATYTGSRVAYLPGLVTVAA